MRGTPAQKQYSEHAPGIIPAYAGNTGSALNSRVVFGDHPRICGEHAPSMSTMLPLTGSSPHMRGTRPIRKDKGTQVGIIPAYAGNTLRWRRGSCHCRDHPRICGEHLLSVTYPALFGGSSPHMRGTHVDLGLPVSVFGIIPAYAGNTNLQGIGIAQWRDHPRICGEHFHGVMTYTFGEGSSPHMRGTPFHANGGYCSPGIIPAYAGNTVAWIRVRESVWDHPRICGEHRGMQRVERGQ